jgi:nucleoside-diphosphate-sugar epimerase
VNGPYNVGLAIKNHRDRIKRVLHVSSDAVYTCYNYLYTPMDEDHPKRPIYPYARVKWIAEETMRSFCLEIGVPFSIIRPGAVAGAGEAGGGATAGSLCWQLRSNNRITSAGAFPGCNFYMPEIPEPWKWVEAQVQSLDDLIIPVDPRGDCWMLHTSDVRDVADGAMLAFEKDEAIGEVFNIVGPRGITWREHAEYLSERLHKPCKELVLPCPAWRYELDISKAKRLLGYSPRYGLKEKVDDSLAFLKGEDVGIVPTDVDKGGPQWEEALHP